METQSVQDDTRRFGAVPMKRIILTWLALSAALFAAWQLPLRGIPHFKSLYVERLLVSPAHAQPLLGFPPGVFDNTAARAGPSGGGGSVSWAETVPAMAASGPYSGTQDWGNLSIGTASSDRIVVVSASVINGNTVTPELSVTIDGVTMTPVSAVLPGPTAAPNDYAGMFYLNVPTGTAPDIQFVSPGGFLNGVAIEVGIIKGSTGTPTAVTLPWGSSTLSNPSLSVTVPSNGKAIAMFAADRPLTNTWSGANSDSYANAGGASVAVGDTVSSGSMSYSGTSAYYGGMASVWSP